MSFLRGPTRVSDTVLSSLASAGIETPVDFLLADLQNLARQTQCSYKELQGLRTILVAQHAAIAVRGDTMYAGAMKSTAVCSTTLGSIDSALDGGMLSGEVVELCGSSGAGKTRVCARTAVETAAKGRAVFYIDTAAAMKPALVLQICEEINVEPTEEILRRLEICCPVDVWEAVATLNEVMVREAAPALVVLDAVTAFMLPALTAEQGIGALTQLSSVLRQLANRCQAVVLLTMHDSDMPIGNVIARMWHHVPHIRLQLRRNAGQQTEFRVTKATRLPTSDQFKPV